MYVYLTIMFYSVYTRLLLIGANFKDLNNANQYHALKNCGYTPILIAVKICTIFSQKFLSTDSCKMSTIIN